MPYCYFKYCIHVFATGPSSSGAMRLYNGRSASMENTAGRVQLWYNGRWGNICDDVFFSQSEADVLCHQLGRSGASDYSYGSLDE